MNGTADIPPPAAVDAFIDAIPDNPYDKCPCGCGIKWRFVIMDSLGNPEQLEQHEQRFHDNYMKGRQP